MYTPQTEGLYLLAIMLLDFKVRVEVEDNLLVGFRGVHNPLTVLVRGIVLRVTWGGDVASILGIQSASAGWVWKRNTTKEFEIISSSLPPGDHHYYFTNLIWQPRRD